MPVRAGPSQRGATAPGVATRRTVRSMSSKRKTSYTRPLDAETLEKMASHIGGAAYEMAVGWVRWARDVDMIAGRASSLAARALIEFLVGRPRRKESDIWPSDYHPNWQVSPEEADLLLSRLAWVDAMLAHLSLDRARGRERPPEATNDTLLRLLRLTRRFADEIADHPAAKALDLPLSGAEAAIEDERQRLLELREQRRRAK